MSEHEPNNTIATVQSRESRADEESSTPESPRSSSLPEQSGVNSDVDGDPASSASGESPKEWKSWKLRYWWMLILLWTEAAFIGTIIFLERRSANEDGVASIQWISTSSVSSGFFIFNFWTYGLLWTALPSLIMALYCIMWGTVVSGTADRQPFVELRKPVNNARTAKVTIMLDYRSYPSFYNWTVAFRNSHVLLGFAMLLHLLLSILLVPLASHIFVAAPSQSSSSILLSYPSEFNESRFTTRTGLQPALNLASAIRVSGSNPPPWMTLEYAFKPFEMREKTTSGNVTAETKAYSAYLDCQTFSADESSATYDSSGGEYLTYQMNDRGCQISGKYLMNINTPNYAVSWYEPCNNSDYGRVGLLAGVYANTSSIKLTNFSLISCIASYWIKTGPIAMSIPLHGSPEFVSFIPSNSTNIHPLLHLDFEDTLPNYVIYDPSATFFTDNFGFLVYSYAKLQNDTSPITPELIKNATEEIFTTIYAALVITELLQPDDSLTQTPGALSFGVTRLYVVTPVAYTIIGFLLLILICNVFLFRYAQKNRSILYEEPIGLLGNAAVLHQDDGVWTFISDFRKNHPKEYNMLDFVKANYAVPDSRCYFEEDLGLIQLNGLNIKESS